MTQKYHYEFKIYFNLKVKTNKNKPHTFFQHCTSKRPKKHQPSGLTQLSHDSHLNDPFVPCDVSWKGWDVPHGSLTGLTSQWKQLETWTQAGHWRVRSISACTPRTRSFHMDCLSLQSLPSRGTSLFTGQPRALQSTKLEAPTTS